MHFMAFKDSFIDRDNHLLQNLKMITILLALVFTLTSFAEPTPWQVKFNTYVKGLPQDTISLLERVDGCEHFGGEESYDEQRRKEILEAVTKLKCDTIDRDRDALLKKYENKTEIVNKIKNFPAALN